MLPGLQERLSLELQKVLPTSMGVNVHAGKAFHRHHLVLRLHRFSHLFFFFFLLFFFSFSSSFFFAFFFPCFFV